MQHPAGFENGVAVSENDVGASSIGNHLYCNPSHCFMELVTELAQKIPVAIVNNQNEKMDVDAVELDNSKLGRIMAKHLLDLGHRRVAYIAPPLTARQKQRSKRVEGFLKEYELSLIHI